MWGWRCIGDRMVTNDVVFRVDGDIVSKVLDNAWGGVWKIKNESKGECGLRMETLWNASIYKIFLGWDSINSNGDGLHTEESWHARSHCWIWSECGWFSLKLFITNTVGINADMKRDQMCSWLFDDDPSMFRVADVSNKFAAKYSPYNDRSHVIPQLLDREQYLCFIFNLPTAPHKFFSLLICFYSVEFYSIWIIQFNDMGNAASINGLIRE